MTTEAITPTEAPTIGDPHTVRIDFLFLDLTTCTRCRGTDHNLGAALTAVADVLTAAGIEVKVNKVHVATEDLARAWRFVSSPTLRVNGADIALELRESSCESEACADGCGEQTACRVWVYGGREYTEPPKAMIVDAILRHAYGAAPESASVGHELPENLRRFFDGTSTSAQLDQSIPDTQPTEVVRSTCCPTAEQQTCCDASAKQDCCGGTTEQGCRCQ
jgi:hypothetical protein